MKPHTHYIFDFDGVVADTEAVFARFDCDLLNKVMLKSGNDATLTPTDIRKLAGNNDVGKLNIIAQNHEFDPSLYMDEFQESRKKLRATLFRDNPVTLGKNIKYFIDMLNGRLALATNKTEKTLRHDLLLMGIEELFDTIITSDPPMKKKPSPDMLIEAARKLNTDPKCCAYIGDNVLDMQASTNAGMTPIGFIIEGRKHNEERIAELTKAGASMIIDDFSDLTPYVIST